MTLEERDRVTIVTALTRSSQAIETVVGQIPQLRQRMTYWERGGHRSSSIPEAISHSGEPPALESDSFDRDMRRHLRWLISNSLTLETIAEQMRRLVGSYLVAAGALEDEETAPCRNPPCDNQVRPRVEKTCSRCRKHKSRYGLAWPKYREEAG